MLSKEKIKESFSRAALTYNEASDFQKEAGRKLIDKVLSDAAPQEKILDVGMGTGSITQQFAIRVGKRIYGCDMAWGMVSFAKANTNGIFISQADIEELPFKDEAFDAVFSNIAYQWACDFTKAFLELKRILRKEGRFYFSILIKDSLRELYDVLETVVKMDSYRNFLPGAEFIKTQLKECDFKIDWCEEQIIRRYYESSLDLIKTFKKIGAGGILGTNLFKMGQRRLFFEMIDTYDKTFNENGKVFATYKVIFGCARKIAAEGRIS